VLHFSRPGLPCCPWKPRKVVAAYPKHKAPNTGGTWEASEKPVPLRLKNKIDSFLIFIGKLVSPIFFKGDLELCNVVALLFNCVVSGSLLEQLGSSIVQIWHQQWDLWVFKLASQKQEVEYYHHLFSVWKSLVFPLILLRLSHLFTGFTLFEILRTHAKSPKRFWIPRVFRIGAQKLDRCVDLRFLAFLVQGLDRPNYFIIVMHKHTKNMHISNSLHLVYWYISCGSALLPLEKSELSLDNRILQRSIALEIPMRFLTLTQAHDPPWLWWHFFYLNGNSWVSGIWRKSSRHGGNLDGWSCSSVSLVCYFEVGVEERTNKPMTKLRVSNFQSCNFEIWRLSSQLTLLGIEALCSGWAVETIRVSPYSSPEPC